LLPSSAQVGHLLRRVSQSMVKPRVGIIGGYHGINAGDLALGYSVQQQLERNQISSGLQTIYNLDRWKWPVADYAIIGGGAVGYNDALEKVYERYKNNLQKVALLGVDFNEERYTASAMELLRHAKWISCRSAEQAERLRSLTQREDIGVHPDLAFALQFDKANSQKQINYHKPVFLVNVVPLYAKVINGEMLPVDQYAEERPDLYESWSIMNERYVQYVRELVNAALQRNYRVETLPFTPMDAAAGKLIFKNLPVLHNPYVPDPAYLVKKIQSAHTIFATRFHATIFGMKLGKKIIPFAYARKNERLLESLGMPTHLFSTPFQLKTTMPEVNIEASYQFEAQRISDLQVQAQAAINSCINSLQLL
jgi:polysaccharide pyruvyl transferase WcaK-like protein